MRLDLGRHEDALKTVLLLDNAQGRNKLALILQSSLLLELNRPVEALQAARKITAREPDSEIGLLLESHVQRKLGNFDKAYDALQFMLAYHPESRRGQRYMATLEIDMGNMDAGIDRLHTLQEKALDMRSLKLLHQLAFEGHGKQRYALLYRNPDVQMALSTEGRRMLHPSEPPKQEAPLSYLEENTNSASPIRRGDSNRGGR